LCRSIVVEREPCRPARRAGRISRRGRERLVDLWPPTLVHAARQSTGAPDAEGWAEVTVPIETVTQTLPELLKLGAELEVLAPARLRAAMGDTVSALATRYT
jgi:predicted DNA-binding transcriptional regulator YafY